MKTILKQFAKKASGRLALSAFAGLVAVSANAQTTVAITNPIPVIFGGAGITGVYPGYTNQLVAFTLEGGTDPVDLSVNVVGAPAGVTAGLVARHLSPNTPANISAVLQTTITTNVYLSVSMVNAPKGNYPLEIIASNTVTAVTFTNSTTLLVSPVVFTALNTSTDTNWSTAANWSAGAPVAGDSVKFQYTNAISATNAFFDTSIVLDSLTLLPQANNYRATNYFAPGVTVAVNGSNGFWAGPDVYTGIGVYNFHLTLVGAGAALVVTNPAAPFSIFSHTYQNSVGSTHNLSALDNLYVDVKRVGIGDGFLIYPKLQGSQPAEMGVYFLAKTNFIRASYVGDYTGAGTLMTNSIMFMNSAGNASGTGNPFVNMGISNLFYADSISVFSHQSGVDAAVMRFNPAFTNGNNAVAVFRGTNGGRMAWLGIGVESGGSGYTGRTRASGLNTTGGRLDLLVDTLVLSQNQTNRNGNYTRGDLVYPNGIVEANIARLGYQAPNGGFTPVNATGVRATLTVGGLGAIGSNAVMNVSGPMSMMEGLFTETAAGSSYVRVNVNNGGKLNVNNITWGTNVLTGVPNPAAGSFVSVAPGGQLTLTNTICSPAVPLPVLSVSNGAALNLHVTLGVTNAFVGNLIDATGAKINILSLTGFSPTVPATNALISYVTAGTHNISIGTYPSGYNNVTIFDNIVDKVIELRVQTNAPAVLRWKGYVNNVWDHTTANWQNTNSLAQVAFFDADSVIFDDAAGVPKVISIADSVIPNSSGVGIYMTNSTSAYAFENGGIGQIGTCSFVKDGSANFTNNVTGTETITFNGGVLLGSGGFGGVTIASTAAFNYAGAAAGAFVTAGSGFFNVGAVANGAFTIQGGAAVTNYGTVQGGALTINSNALLVNATGGWLKSIGSSGAINVAAGGTLVNVGDIGRDPINDGFQANTLTVSGTFKDMGVGNIYLTTATMNGGSTFLPGGDGIGTTHIRSVGGAGFPGRLTMLGGSTNLILVDFANPQTNTVVIASYTDFGGNTAVKSYDGCTVLFSNINTGAGVFALSQAFRPFTGPGGSDIGNEGLNTTNRYPIVSPFIPLANSKWDLSQVRDTSPNGTFVIASFPTTGTNVVSSFYKDGGNIVTYLQWPSEYIGWKIQQQTNELSAGLKTNWVTITTSSATNELYITNDAAIPATFFRMTYP